MQCTKTGCLIYIVPYNIYAYGDAYGSVNGVAVFRLVEESFEPLNGSNLHYTVYDVGQWFDRSREGGQSTLITNLYENHGYEGKAIAK